MDSTVSMHGIVRRFGPVTACDGADFSARAGVITALVGENGAGKTTLMRILAGRLRRDAGSITVDGSPARLASPRAAAALGIGMVEQDCPVVPGLSVLENILLGAEESRAAFISKRKTHKRIAEIAAPLNLEPLLSARAETISAPDRQRTAIARALYRGARVLILDEPTSLVGPADLEPLFDCMRSLAAAGTAVIFISHKLSEVFRIADTITVLRQGRSVFESETGRTSPDEVAKAMVGGDQVEESITRREPTELIVALENVSTAGDSADSLKDVWLNIRAHEITGIAGVAGNGQRALADVTSGLDYPEEGWPIHKLNIGIIASISEDVDSMDLVPSMRVWENVVLGRESDFRSIFGLSAAKARRVATKLARDFSVAGAVDAPVKTLSGGNRQRLVLARELSSNPRLIVAEQPTRGLDVKASQLVRNRLRKAADSGAAVLLISYDLDELLLVADRILVISSGRLIKPSTQPPSREELISLMTA